MHVKYVKNILTYFDLLSIVNFTVDIDNAYNLTKKER